MKRDEANADGGWSVSAGQVKIGDGPGGREALPCSADERNRSLFRVGDGRVLSLKRTEGNAIVHIGSARVIGFVGEQPIPVGQFNASHAGKAVHGAIEITEGSAEEESENFGVDTLRHLVVRDAIPAAVAQSFEVAAAVDNAHENSVERIGHS